jgi:hypothetical protein
VFVFGVRVWVKVWIRLWVWVKVVLFFGFVLGYGCVFAFGYHLSLATLLLSLLFLEVCTCDTFTT